MILRVAAALAAILVPWPLVAADKPARVPPDRAAMSQFIATPGESVTGGATREGSAAPARKAKRVRYTIPAPKRM